MNIKSCRNCTDRKIGCHSTCKKYIDECKQRAEEKARIQLDSEWSKYAYDRHDEIEKVTRFERLKEMTVEEIAEWWTDNIDCEECPFEYECSAKSMLDMGALEACKNSMIIILNREVIPEDQVCGSCAIDYPQEEISAEQIIGEEENDESKTGD